MSFDNSSRFLRVGLIVLILLSSVMLYVGLTTINTGPTTTTSTTSTFTSIPGPIEYNASGPIKIVDNADFAEQAALYNWSGDGSSGNPYVIESIEIDIQTTEPYSCIEIIDVTVHFAIRYCKLRSTNQWLGTGINLLNSQNGLISHCIIYDTEWGINMIEAEDILVKHCEMTNSNCALNVTASHNIEFFRNHITGAEGWGFMTGCGSTDLTLSSNGFTSCNTGLYIFESDNGIFNNNTV